MSEATTSIDSSEKIRYMPPDYADEGDRGLSVRFYWDAVKNSVKSKEGRIVYDKYEFVEIMQVGGKDSIVRKVTEQDKNRFPGKYLKFKMETEEPPDGTPLEMWPMLDIAEVKMLKANGIDTVEQLAAASDTNIQTLGHGWLEKRKAALAYLEVSENAASAQKYAMENERLKQEMALMREQFQEQLAELKQRMDGPQKRGPGRPRKDENREEER